jgi:hypothetical protein
MLLTTVGLPDVLQHRIVSVAQSSFNRFNGAGQ